MGVNKSLNIIMYQSSVDSDSNTHTALKRFNTIKTISEVKQHIRKALINNK